MVLFLLLVLAFLIWMIQSESESKASTPALITKACPGCQKSVDIDYMICPHCTQQLCEPCTSCYKGKLISQRFCPFCGSLQRDL